jgi:hypothetical protein
VTRRASIGFDRRLDRAWLDAAAAKAAEGAKPEEFRAHMWTLLEDVVTGTARNSARGKTVSVLAHVWGTLPPHAVGLRQRACASMALCSPDERLALHWAMMIGTYPVFTDVASAIGRLLALQGSLSLTHLTRRLSSSWGQRSTLSRAAQRIVRSMVQWGVLSDTPQRGHYARCSSPLSVGRQSGLLLIEALLIDADASSMPVEHLARHPALFPFEWSVSSGDLRSAPQFLVHREGLDSDLVELRKG